MSTKTIFITGSSTGSTPPSPTTQPSKSSKGPLPAP
jgi:hypothetical protein